MPAVVAAARRGRQSGGRGRRPAATRDDIASALTHLRNGGLLIYPTETSYAIGCDATNAAAVRAVFRAKGRDAGKSLPLIVASHAMAARYATLTPLARQLARKHWPGPLTIVLRRSGGAPSPPVRRSGTPPWLPEGGDGAPPLLPRGIVAPNGTIALRISSHPTARTLSRRLGRPIVATSANRSGDTPARSARQATQIFRVRDAIRILDGGILPRRVPSTIVDATGSTARVLRQGNLSLSLRGSIHPPRITKQPWKK